MARALAKDAELLLFDEPLVNLDYKLREELRVEMREIFKRRSAVVVYATTEPLEALLLGGSVVVLDQGRVLQTGSTVEVYHHPHTFRVGQVFSDPPMNIINGVVADGEARLGSEIRVPLLGHLAELPSGQYSFGARANHLSISRSATDDVVIKAVTELAEVNGSETFIHVRHHDTSWVIQEEGVHSLRLGRQIQVFVNPRHIFAFDSKGQLAAAPSRDKKT
jgi:glycerol transport system ATP-binding protein